MEPEAVAHNKSVLEGVLEGREARKLVWGCRAEEAAAQENGLGVWEGLRAGSLNPVFMTDL